MNSDYKKTVALLLQMLPTVMKDKRIALKGGTAINLFHRDFPRLSIDIDLCYLPLESREETFKNVHQILQNIKENLETNMKLAVHSNYPLNGKKEAKLTAKKNYIEVKIEPNYTLRSSLFPPETKTLSPKAQTEFGMEIEIQCLNLADIFGGKICAALDRQHPRDLFDVKNLLENEGINPEIKDSLIFYLISHNRPVNELLNPNFKNIENEYKKEFRAMAKVDTPLDDLLETRRNLVNVLKEKFSEKDKEFLVSFVSNNPDWLKVRDSKIKNYPSVKWKLFNQNKMGEQKLKKYIRDVEKLF